MEKQALTRFTHRLPHQTNEVIDRNKNISFTFNNKVYNAYQGDTIASALAANGVKVLSRSFKYHRPRGLLCNSGHCPNCLVQVGKEPNVRACLRPVEDGMKVQSQNVWPSIDLDVMSLTEVGNRFLPVGFYYKTFIRPKRLWPFYENVLRHAAGLGKIDPDVPWESYEKQYLNGDIVIVGGGPAGLSAAIAAAEDGASVLLFDENPSEGGHLRFAGGQRNALSELISAVQENGNISVYSDTVVLGWWEENWMSAVTGNRLYKIRAGSTIFATGAYEQPLVFENNDLPGIMLGSAVQRLLHLHRVSSGERAVVVTTNDEGWQIAADLQAAGTRIVGVVDERTGDQAAAFAHEMVNEGTPVFWKHTVWAAQGNKVLREVIVLPVNEAGADLQSAKTLACDLLVVSAGWAPANGLIYQGGGKIKFDESRADFVPEELPPGIFAAGRATGTHDLQNEMEEGRQAGREAAAFLGFRSLPTEPINPDGEKTGQPKSASTRNMVPGKGKQFICFCEDVTYKDLKVAIQEGYDSIELLKRYSTISMGPCQGKMCSVNTIHLCARENGKTVGETGTTTARPPTTPVKLGLLAGQVMEPVRFTPVHDWHIAHGAKMLVAGLWMRPEHYGDPIAEVRAVRERAGLIDVSTLGKLRMTGLGVPDLLDRLYVNKWQKLSVGKVRYGVMCNDEGVVMDDGVTARLGESEWYTTTTSSGANAIYEWIQWWLQSGWGEGVHVTNITENFAAFNLAGPRSREILETLSSDDISNEGFPYMGVRVIEIAGVPCTVFRIGFTGELSYEIHCPSGYGTYLWEALIEAGKAFDILPFGVEAQRVLRLEKAHIIVGQDTDALTDPISADMSWIVKHDKPNFLGNRPLARIKEAGASQKLVGFKMATAGVTPEEGLQIVQEGEGGQMEIIGWVTSSRFSPTLNEALGLCWLPASMAEKDGAPFRIRRNGQLVAGRVHHGPFYDPDGERLRM